MRSFLLFLVCSFCLCLAPAAAQNDYAPPLKGPLLVTGTFGELRTDHWHAGLDFRGATGTPVYAVQEGYVSRVVVKGGGYGQAVYVDHPDGYRSVYAHLETLSPALLDTVRARQYAEESFYQDLCFDSLAFPVTRGQRIGAVGNRGHSFGSHLHFEMRTAADDVPVNPLRFGFSVPDRRAPQIRSVRVYELDANGHELAATTYELPLPKTVRVRTPHVGIAAKAYDRQDAMPNWNGIYAATLTVDSLRRSGFVYDSISFADTEYLNAETDYREWHGSKSWFHRIWARPQVPHQGKTAMNNGAMIDLQAGEPSKVRVDVHDFAGNQTTVNFDLLYQPDTSLRAEFPHQYYLPAGEESWIERAGFSLHLPATALYEDLYFRFQSLPDASQGRYSPTYRLHDRLTPLHGRATLRIRPHRPVPDSLRSKAFIGQCHDDGSHSSRGGAWTEDGHLETSIGRFGDYAIFLDTLPPTVEIASFPTKLSRYQGFSVFAKDDVAGGGLSYRGTVDGQWVLLEYDAKNDKLTHRFESARIGPGRHRFELTVSDARGNTTTWARNFTR